MYQEETTDSKMANICSDSTQETQKSLQNAKKPGLPTAWQLFTDRLSADDVIEAVR